MQIDPEHPALPISHPAAIRVYLAKLLGSFATLGMAEDTWALNEGAIERDAISPTGLFDLRRARSDVHHALEHTRRGVVAASSTPATACSTCSSARWIERVGEFAGVIEDLYRRMDRVVGEALRHVDPARFCSCSPTMASAPSAAASI